MAFAGFDPATVAGSGSAGVARLLADSGIVWHRGTIEAAVTSARALLGCNDGRGPGRWTVWSGPTTVHAAMQACGIVDDHLAGCAFRRSASTAHPQPQHLG